MADPDRAAKLRRVKTIGIMSPPIGLSFGLFALYPNAHLEAVQNAILLALIRARSDASGFFG